MTARTRDRRTLGGQLQRLAGPTGEICDYRHTTDPDHPATGWYWIPHPATILAGCTCPHCTAAAATAPAYLGHQVRQALETLLTHAHEHG